MQFDLKFVLGVSSAIISFIAYFFYIYSIFKGRSRPNTFTWATLSLNAIIISIAYYVGGAWNTLWISISYAIGPLIITFLSLKFGEKRWKKVESFSLFSIIICLLLWYLSGSALLALIFAIFIDFLSLLPTIEKSYNRPWTEDRVAWLITLVANIINIFALENWSVELSLFPIYLLFVDGIITIILFQKNQSISLEGSTPTLEK